MKILQKYDWTKCCMVVHTVWMVYATQILVIPFIILLLQLLTDIVSLSITQHARLSHIGQLLFLQYRIRNFVVRPMIYCNRINIWIIFQYNVETVRSLQRRNRSGGERRINFGLLLLTLFPLLIGKLFYLSCPEHVSIIPFVIYVFTIQEHDKDTYSCCMARWNRCLTQRVWCLRTAFGTRIQVAHGCRHLMQLGTGTLVLVTTQFGSLIDYRL